MYISLKGLFVALSSLFIVTATQSTNEVKVEYTASVVEERPHPKQDFIDYLIDCESGGNSEAINHQDKNITGEASFGLYQFQPKTFFVYGKKYGYLPNDLEYGEVMNLIFDEELQHKIAKQMLISGLEHHWKVCYHKYVWQQKSKSVPSIENGIGRKRNYERDF